MVYKWGGTDGGERCLGVQGHRLPMRGVEMVGHEIETEHAGAPNLRQWIT